MGRPRSFASYQKAINARTYTLSHGGRYTLKPYIRVRAFVSNPGHQPNTPHDFSNWGTTIPCLLGDLERFGNTVFKNAVVAGIEKIAEERAEGKTCRESLGTWMGVFVHVEVL